MSSIVVPERPYHFSWDLTTACNLHCSFCYAAGGRANPAESPELVDTILKNITELRPLHLGIGGGDPLLSPFISYVLESLSALREDTPITTVDSMEVAQHEEVVQLIRRQNERLGENRFGVYLSLHGIGEAHDRIVGRRGHFEAQMGAVKLLLQHGVNFSIGIVPTQHNLDQLDAVLTLALNLKAGLLNISQFVPTGRGKKTYENNLTAEQYRALLDWIVTRNAEIGRRYIVTHEHWMSAIDPQLFSSKLFVGCSAGIYYFGVRSNGDIVPCQLTPYVLSNVKETRLVDVWHNHPDLARWRERRVNGRCKTCPLVSNCGGCRCNAVAYTGDFFGEDPLCPFSPEELRARCIAHSMAAAKETVQPAFLPRAWADEATIAKAAQLATRQGDSLVIRNENYNTFVELTGDAGIIYNLVPIREGMTLGNLKSVFKEHTGRDVPMHEVDALVNTGVLQCSQ